MAYFLRFDGVNDEVQGSALSSITTANTLSIEIKFSTSNPLQNDKKLYSLDLSSTNGLVLISTQADGTIRCFIRSDGNLFLFTPAINAGQVYTLKVTINFTSGDVDFYLDSALVDSVVGHAGLVGVSATTTRGIGYEVGLGNHALFDLYRLKEITDGSAISDYDPSASNGTGLILIDVVGTNDGTLINFPTDDSQWVSYVTATFAVTNSLGNPSSAIFGETLTVTTSNWGAEDPTHVDITGPSSNVLTLPLTATATANEYTFTMPTISETEGTSVSGLLAGAVTIRTYSATGDSVTNATTIALPAAWVNTATLEAGFNAQPTSQLTPAPVAGDQLSGKTQVEPLANGNINADAGTWPILHLQASTGTIYTHSIDSTQIQNVVDAVRNRGKMRLTNLKMGF